jgi:hypothetical protein
LWETGQSQLVELLLRRHLEGCEDRPSLTMTPPCP